MNTPNTALSLLCRLEDLSETAIRISLEYSKDRYVEELWRASCDLPGGWRFMGFAANPKTAIYNLLRVVNKNRLPGGNLNIEKEWENYVF